MNLFSVLACILYIQWQQLTDTPLLLQTDPRDAVFCALRVVHIDGQCDKLVPETVIRLPH